MKTIQFNTGRKYTVHGQRVVATLHDDGTFTFHDIDRMVTGEVEAPDADAYSFTERMVMEAYDNIRYTNTTRAWSDGMARGGVNSKWKE
jgi:hypothetical protein